MPKDRLIAYLKSRLAGLERHSWLGPWRHHFSKRSLWSFNRRSVSRGVAIGLFFGVMTPVAQILFAAIVAIVLRANLLVAAGSTLVSNPFTFPFIYYGAFRIGVFLTGPSREIAEDLEISEEAAAQALDVESWFATLTTWFSEVGYPLLVGLLFTALTLSLIGYLTTYGVWRLFVGGRARLRKSKVVQHRQHERQADPHDELKRQPDPHEI